jgi:hypothetical protein
MPVAAVIALTGWPISIKHDPRQRGETARRGAGPGRLPRKSHHK